MDHTDKSNQSEANIIRDAARHLYESTPSSLVAVAAEFGVTDRTIKRWSSSDGGWRKLTGPKITARAQAIADEIKATVTNLSPQAAEDEREAATAALRAKSAVDQRASILARHRSEWGIVRGLVAEAVSTRDSRKAKMALDVGRAIELAQRGEARAWGLDADESNQGAVTVVIERVN